MIRIYNSRIPKLFNAGALFIYPFIFFNRWANWTDRTIFKHEMIHAEQARRFGFWKFFFISLWDRFRVENSDINGRLEIEAYKRQYEPLTPLEESMLMFDRNRELIKWGVQLNKRKV